MTTTQTAEAVSPPVFATSAVTPKRRRRKSQASELTQLRDGLPFFKKDDQNGQTSWWHVTPTGDYATDIATGRAFAREFLPMLTFNAGASTLGAIASDMAKAGRYSANSSMGKRGIDNVALGFMMQIADSLQSAIVGIAIAQVAIQDPASDLGPKFIEQVESGALLRGSSRSSLFSDPDASIFDRH